MSDITDGLGSAIEGAMAGRAVEAEHGGNGTAPGDSQDRTCLNCGALPNGNFCQNCGQKVDIHRSIAAIGHDLLHGVLHLDGKLWRTLPLLAFKPGKLTRRYIDGERAKFVSPMAMFLFSVFLMFAIFQALGLTAPTDLEGDARAEIERLVAKEAEQVTLEIAGIDEDLAGPELSDAERTNLEKRRGLLERDLTLLDVRGEGIAQWLTSSGGDAINAIRADATSEIADARRRLADMPEGSPERADLEAEIAISEQGLEELNNLEEKATETINSDDSVLSQVSTKPSGVDWIDQAVAKWRSNPGLMLYKLQTNAYKFSWLLIPLSVPFVWLVFAWKRRFKAYDHAIFVTYSIAFMSLFYIAVSVLGWLGATASLLTLASLLVPPIHIYKQLRHTYQLSRFSAFWRLAFLLFSAAAALVVFVQILFLLGAF